MRYTDNKMNTYTQTIYALARLGILPGDIDKLRRISSTLNRWHELECGDSNDHASWGIERDEVTDIPYMVTYWYRHNDGKPTRRRIADREKGALRRLATIMAAYPELGYYIQGDPRGCPLYICQKDDANGQRYTNGIAV